MNLLELRKKIPNVQAMQRFFDKQSKFFIL